MEEVIDADRVFVMDAGKNYDGGNSTADIFKC